MRDFLMGEFGYDPVQPEAGTALKISITRIGRTLRVELQAEDAAGNILWDEGFDETNCTTLIRHSALKVKINMDDFIASPPVPSPPAPAPTAAPPAPSATPPIPPPSPPASSSPKPRTRQPEPTPHDPSTDRIRFVVGLEALAHVGITPSVSAGGGVSFGLRWRNYGLLAAGRVAASVIPYETAREAEREPALPIHSLFIAATAGPCYHLGAFAGCAVVDIGTLRFSARRPGETFDPGVFAVGALFAGERPVAGRFAFRGTVEISGTITHPGFDFDSTTRWQTPPVFAAFGIGVTATF